jgi:hypothetical protein
MCMFSGPVYSVGSTKIFARFLDGKEQVIVYEMSVDARDEVAMVLPIPIVQPAAEHVVTFIDLSGYPEFFKDLDKAFPNVTRGSKSLSSVPQAASADTLKVQHVGSFEASFVPTIKDFSRLDERFRLPPQAWDKLPQYRSYGFAVFKLKKGKQDVHPMAFRFPTARPGELFFPTVHVHDGEVHDEEHFDHSLYAQAWKNAVVSGLEWRESEKSAATFMDEKKSAQLIWRDGHLYKQSIHGKRKNVDIIGKTRPLG